MNAPEVEILYTSSAILERLLKLLGSPDKDDRRVALVAYVGGGARAFLAAPDGMRVICNPSPGGTSARVLRELIQAGAKVQLSQHLHAKVYWSEKRGCIVGSANASTNALGVGGLVETAVFFATGHSRYRQTYRRGMPTRRDGKGARKTTEGHEQASEETSARIGRGFHATEQVARFHLLVYEPTQKYRSVEDRLVGSLRRSG